MYTVFSSYYHSVLHLILLSLLIYKSSLFLLSLFLHVVVYLYNVHFILRSKGCFMKILKTFIQIIILYAFFMLGNFLQTIFHLPISGSIIGLFLLFGALLLKIIPVSAIKQGSEFLLLFLTLFFVPATIGIIKYPFLFSSQGALIVLVVILSTIITLIIVGKTSQFIESKVQKRKAEQ